MSERGMWKASGTPTVPGTKVGHDDVDGLRVVDLIAALAARGLDKRMAKKVILQARLKAGILAADDAAAAADDDDHDDRDCDGDENDAVELRGTLLGTGSERGNPVVGADGHFDIPFGTVTIEGIEHECEECDNIDGIPRGADSWGGWGVDKTTVRTVTIPDTVQTIGRDGFSGCSSLISVAVPSSVISIGETAFLGCNSLKTADVPTVQIGGYAFAFCWSLTTVTLSTLLTSLGTVKYDFVNGPSFKGVFGDCEQNGADSVTTLLVRPDGDGDADRHGDGTEIWGALLAPFTNPDCDPDIHIHKMPYEEIDEEELYDNFKQFGALLPGVTRVWAPDHIIQALTGAFNPYATFAEVPRAMRAAPDATTWAAVQLWLWWSPPTGAGYTNRDGVCTDDRIVCRPRRAALFNAVAAGSTAATAGRLQGLPEGVWLLIFGWLQHDETPTFPQ